jgi:hypothetical protein
MKNIIVAILFITGILSIHAQTDKTAILQDLESHQAQIQDNTPTATIQTSTRLFKNKDDLTSVILIIPSGSVVSVLGSDSTYLIVNFEDNKGYIFRKHAVLDKAPATFKEMESAREAKVPTDRRYDALERKYGSSMAARIYAGKIWKGMNSEMVRDSWGTAEKINRVVSGNIIKEEWIYRSTWLHFENNTLVNWGPTKN